MNKIYKVIWSKVRNCYVAVSEIAKRNGKSCTSVNCGAKANRSHVALALSLALCVTGGVFVSPQAAWADGTITVSDAGQPQNYTTTTGGTLSYDFNTRVYYSTESSITELKITGGQIDPYYGFAGCLLDGNVSGHTVTVSGTDTFVGSVCGGVTPFTDNTEHTVESNKVIVSGGKVDYVYGGMANSRNMTNFAKNNKVSIEAVLNGSEYTVTTKIFGGYASKNGVITGNTVNIRKGKVNDVFGGYNYESGSVGGDEEGEGNKVTITGGTVMGSVYGGYVRAGTGSVINNEVSITGGETKDVIGGESSSGSVIGNKVTIDTTVTGATDVSVQRVYGGKGNGSAEITGNEVSIRGSKTAVNISGSTIGENGMYGGHSSGSGTVSKNTVTISNEAKVNSFGVYGGYSATGAAGGTTEDEGNKVTISDSTVSRESGQGQVVVMGGRSEGSGNSNYNGVAINNSLLTTDSTNYITGGRSVDGNTNFNKVTINGSTITTSKTDTSVHVYGGRSDSNTASSNVVTVVDSTVKGIVAGGRSGLTADNSKINGNRVSISGTNADNITETGDVYGGYNLGTGAATNAKVGGEGEGNTVTISGYTKTGHVYGGYSNYLAEVSGNVVTITGGETGQVFGGDGAGGSVSGNKVIIDTTGDGATDVKVMDVYGGHNDSTLSGNEVVIRGSKTTVTGSGTTRDTETPHGVYGGGTISGGTVSGNTVTISDGATVNTNVYGGRSTLLGSSSGEAKGNTVVISDSTVNSVVYGGYSYSGNAGGTAVGEGNTVTINGGTVRGSIYGGYSDKGKAIKNSVNIKNANVENSSSGTRGVYGGRTDNKNDVSGNIVTITDSKVNLDVYGGKGAASVYGNWVTISQNGETETNIGGNVYGGFSLSGTAGSATADKGNKVTINGSATEITGEVYGGYVDSGSGAANFNSVEITGGTLGKSVYGGYSKGKANSSHANSNTVAMTGGELKEGSYGYRGTLYGGYSYYGSANENIVNISGNSVTGGVYGGATSYDYYSAVDQTADGNQVTISGSAIVEGVTGGYSYGKGANSHANGNIVTVSGNASTGGILAGGSDNSSASNNQIIIKTENSSDNVSVKGQSSLSVTAGDAGYIYNSDSGYVYGDANGNSITVSGNVFIGLTDNGQWNDASITAGSAGGNATDNHITIEIDNGGIGKINDPDASATYSITAGWGDVATGNTVEIKKGKINVSTIYGAYGSSKVQNNKVTVSGMDSDLYRSGTIYGGRGSNSSSSENVLVSGNRVEITGGKLTYSVFGGYAGAKSGKVTDNHVNISGEGTELKASYIVGGEGSSNEMEVSDNHVTISGSYNWTDNASEHNDENIEIIQDWNNANICTRHFMDDWNK